MLHNVRPKACADEILDDLAGGDPVTAPLAVVAAHPDDECLSFGLGMSRARHVHLIHLTDGAPLDMADARRAGFETRVSYAEARRLETEAALAALGVAPARRIECLVPDQTAVERLAALSEKLATELACVEAVITHPYEGGHPDHDACAFAVQAACALILRRGGRPPARLEFASYHLRAGALAAGRFFPDPRTPEVVLPADCYALERKRVALAQYASQAGTLEALGFLIERARRAPDYDFRKGPPPGASLYDDFGLSVTSPRWRDRAAEALDELCL